MALSCDAKSLVALATCFRCVPREMRRAVREYLLCQWANGASVPPGKVQSSPATNVDSVAGSFRANWHAVASATGYIIDVDKGDPLFVNPPPVTTALGNVVFFDVSGADVMIPYYYRVRATNDSGTGPNSDIVTVQWGV